MSSFPPELLPPGVHPTEMLPYIVPKIPYLQLSHPWYPLMDHLGSREKTVVGKLRRKECANIRVGEYLWLGNQTSLEIFRVRGVRYYSSIRQYLYTEGLRNTLPGVTTLAKGIEIYQESFSEKEVRELGLIGFEVEWIDLW